MFCCICFNLSTQLNKSELGLIDSAHHVYRLKVQEAGPGMSGLWTSPSKSMCSRALPFSLATGLMIAEASLAPSHRESAEGYSLTQGEFRGLQPDTGWNHRWVDMDKRGDGVISSLRLFMSPYAKCTLPPCVTTTALVSHYVVLIV